MPYINIAIEYNISTDAFPLSSAWNLHYAYTGLWPCVNWMWRMERRGRTTRGRLQRRVMYVVKDMVGATVEDDMRQMTC